MTQSSIKPSGKKASVVTSVRGLMLEHQDAADAFRRRLLETVKTSPGISQHIDIFITSSSLRAFTANFKFFPRVSPTDSSLTSHSSLVFWVGHILKTLGLTANALPKFLSSRHFASEHFIWVVPGRGYVLVEPMIRFGENINFAPDWSLSFLTEDNGRMRWRGEQLQRVKNSLAMLDSFEFDLKTGSVTRQPSQQTYREALSELRGLLQQASLIG